MAILKGGQVVVMRASDRKTLNWFRYDSTNDWLQVHKVLHMGSKKIVGLADGTADSDAAAKGQAGGGGTVLLESVSDWSSQPAGWRNLHGDKDESIDTLTYASGGLTLASQDNNTKANGVIYNPVGVVKHHESKAFTAVATFDTFSVGGVDSGDDWWISLMHTDGAVSHGSTGEIRFYYDGNKSSGSNSWQAYLVHRKGGATSMTWSSTTNVTDTTPTGLKLRMQFDGMEGFKVAYSVNTGGGYGSFVDVPNANYTDLKADGSVSELTPPVWGPRTFSIAIGNYGDMSSGVSCRLTDLTVTGAS